MNFQKRSANNCNTPELCDTVCHVCGLDSLRDKVCNLHNFCNANLSRPSFIDNQLQEPAEEIGGVRRQEMPWRQKGLVCI